MLNINLLKKSLIVAVALGLTACANTDALESNVTALTNKVDSLSSQLDSLSNNVAELKSQQQAVTDNAKAAKMAAEQAASDALKANERIDNVVASFKK